LPAPKNQQVTHNADNPVPRWIKRELAEEMITGKGCSLGANDSDLLLLDACKLPNEALPRSIHLVAVANLTSFCSGYI
jgi:hypothetical protein